MSKKYHLLCFDCNSADPCELSITTDLLPVDIKRCPIDKKANWQLKENNCKKSESDHKKQQHQAQSVKEVHNYFATHEGEFPEGQYEFDYGDEKE